MQAGRQAAKLTLSGNIRVLLLVTIDEIRIDVVREFVLILASKHHATVIIAQYVRITVFGQIVTHAIRWKRIRD